jgi:hypothetical protein
VELEVERLPVRLLDDDDGKGHAASE